MLVWEVRVAQVVKSEVVLVVKSSRPGSASTTASEPEVVSAEVI